MTTFLILLGAALVAISLWDILLCALGAGQSGALSRAVARFGFARMRTIGHTRIAHRICGPVTMAWLGAVWIAAVAFGWSLIFFAASRSLETTKGLPAASFADSLSYAGHLLSTLGGGYANPAGTGWSLISVITGVTGMLVLTLAVSFVFSTTQAAAQGRAVMALAEVFPPGSDEFTGQFLPQFSSYVAQVKSIPFALFYSTARPQRRLPRGIYRLWRDARLTETQRRALRIILHEIPGLEEVAPERFDGALLDWAMRHDLCPNEMRRSQ
ncbi:MULTISPECIES: hypothetical protein [Thioclava]|uniref:hypothetical protein n=1 Tax=Thioclava TaxID=285107 RepID=UPI00098A494E|nr:MULTISPECIES: hypothetical protein [Thioclava]OWY04339.1 hypothetical protein B6V76_07380 [Thioclava sp. IC9]OWY05852.1 hypothetical protein B6V75_07045 [Thioclava sp. F1Mire-8]OWY11146.1 hypothetical protein B6V74_03775 [Thioclava sp. F42-5]OWY17846.1 hypothetical protein B6V73_04325 [Thioclava sp. JM3]PWE51059.1 hypothetical protein DEM26_03970 [Thioclava sp. NG1]